MYSVDAFGVQGLGSEFRVKGSKVRGGEFGVDGSGFRVWGLGFRVWRLGYRAGTIPLWRESIQGVAEDMMPPRSNDFPEERPSPRPHPTR